MNVKSIRKQDLRGKPSLYFVRYDDDSVCVFQRAIQNRITENDGKRYRLWSASLDELPSEEHSKAVDSVPDDFVADQVNIAQEATERHLKSLLGL